MIPRRLFAAALALALFVPPASAGEAPAEALRGAEWPQFKGGPGFTGVSPDKVVKPPLKLLWSYRTGADGTGDAGGGCTVAGGKIFTTVAEDRSLLALDADTGAYLWEYRNMSLGIIVPAYNDGRVYVWMRRSSPSRVAAIDAKTGKELWNVPLENKGVVGWEVFAGIEGQRTGLPVHDGKVFCVGGGDRPAAVALDEKTGREVWRCPLVIGPGQKVGAPSVAGGRVFLGIALDSTKERKGQVLALEEATGKVLWKREDLEVVLPPVSDGRSLVFAPADGCGLYLLDAASGNTLWSVLPKGRQLLVFDSPPTLTDDMVLSRGYGGGFEAYDRKTGQLLWKFDGKGGGSGCCTPTVSGGYAYFGTGDPGVGGNGFSIHFEKPVSEGKGHGVFVVDLATGKPAWSFLTGWNVCGEPAIAYGRVYVISRDGRIYCFVPAKEGEPTTPEAKDRSAGAPAEEVKKLLAPELADKPRPGKDWPMEGGGPERAGVEGVGLKPPLEPAWKIETGGAVRSSAAIRDGRVFVGSDAGKLLAVEAASGRVLWEVKTGAPVRCSPAAAGGTVYCGADDGAFCAWDAASGQQKWKFEAGGPVRASPAVVGGAVVFGADDHNVYALDRATGRKLWSFRGSFYQVPAPPVVRGDTVYVIEGINWVHALDLTTGQERWKTFFPKRLDAVALYRDRLWVSGYHMAALDPQTGKILITTHGGGGRLAFAKGTVLVGATPFNLDVEDKKPGYQLGLPMAPPKPLLRGGSRLWPTGAPLALGETLVFGTAGGEVVVTQPDGTPVWTFPLGTPCTNSPAAADGLLVVGAGDGKLYGFREKAR